MLTVCTMLGGLLWLSIVLFVHEDYFVRTGTLASASLKNTGKQNNLLLEKYKTV